ncbi:hypothetical protein CsNV_052 [Callinectes sapidus nudivirus]|nr:hypothetical protein CsNV_052 [Callinectes sapidus nudivirus]
MSNVHEKHVFVKDVVDIEAQIQINHNRFERYIWTLIAFFILIPSFGLMIAGYIMGCNYLNLSINNTTITVILIFCGFWGLMILFIISILKVKKYLICSEELLYKLYLKND